jgi:hypothetical protein
MADIANPPHGIDLKMMHENAEVETTPEGHKKTWLLDHRIVIFRGTDSSSRTAVDTYYDVVLATFDAWPKNQLLLVGFDFRNIQFSTPYQMMVGTRMLLLRSDLTSYMALILANGIAGQVGKLASTRFKRPNGVVRAYFDLDDALNWMAKQALNTPGPA